MLKTIKMYQKLKYSILFLFLVSSSSIYADSLLNSNDSASSSQISNINRIKTNLDSINNVKVEAIPKQPIVQSVIGGTLAITGGILFASGGVMFLSACFQDHTITFKQSIIALGSGIVITIPGGILIHNAKKKWEIYFEWLNKQSNK